MLLGLLAGLPCGVQADVPVTPYHRLQVLLPGEEVATLTETGKTGSPDDQVAGVPFPVRVRTCNLSWSTNYSVNHVMRITATDDTADLPEAAPVVSGEGEYWVTLNSPGFFLITAEDLTEPEHRTATSALVRVLPSQGELEGFMFSPVETHQFAGVPATVTVRAVDAEENTVTDYSGRASLAELTSFGEGRLDPIEIQFVAGIWTGEVTLFTADEETGERPGGNVRIEAVDIEDEGVDGLSNCFQVHPGAFSRLQLVVPGQIRVHGSPAGLAGWPVTQSAGRVFSAEVYATDEYWNRRPDSALALLSSTDGAATPPLTELLVDGHATIPVILVTPGSHTLTVHCQSDPEIAGMTSPEISVIAGDPNFIIDPFATLVTAGDSVTVRLRVTDAVGATIEDYDSPAVLSASSGPGTIHPESINFQSGVWTGKIVFYQAGTGITFTCMDYSSPPFVTTSPDIEVLPGAFAGFQVLMPGQTPVGGTVPGATGEPAEQEAGISFDLTVRAVDSWWNLVPAVNDSIDLICTDVFADVPPRVALYEGQLTLPVTLLRAGNHTVAASGQTTLGPASHTSSTFAVRPGPYAQLMILAPGEELVPGLEAGKLGVAIDQSVSYSFLLRLFATDPWWNPVAAVDDLIEITSTDPLAQLPLPTPLSDGFLGVDVRLATGGFQLLTARNLTRPEIPPTQTQVRAIDGSLHFEAEVHPEVVQAGESFTLTIRVTNDAGTVMSEVNSIALIEARNAGTGEPGSGDLFTTQIQLLQGERSLQQTYTRAEPIVLVIGDQIGSEAGVTNVLTVGPAAAAEVTLMAADEWLPGHRETVLTATVLDPYGNPVPGQPVVFTVTAGEGTVTPLDEVTDDLGCARATFHSPYLPENGMVRATSGLIWEEMDIQTALVDPDLPGGTVTNYPNPFHPDQGPTTIAYRLDDEAAVTMRIYTLSGGLVLEERFATGQMGGQAGVNEYPWTGRNGNGKTVASGGYIILIEAERGGETMHTMRRRVGIVR